MQGLTAAARRYFIMFLGKRELFSIRKASAGTETTTLARRLITLINFSPVVSVGDIHYKLTMVYRIDDTVGTDPEPVHLRMAPKLFPANAGWP